MTPAGHLLSGYLAGAGIARGGPERRWILGAALLGSIAPDFDVALGLLGGWLGAAAHRGVTHSLLGAVLIAGLVAAAGRKHFRPVFLACFAGVLTHIFWDWLNPWGVRPLWPWPMPVRGNLVHERDLLATGIVALAAVLLWRGRGRVAWLTLATLLPAYLLLQLWWRQQARGLAQTQLAGRRAEVYPTARPGCGWLVLSAGENDVTAHCFSSPWEAGLRPVSSVALRDDFFTRASQQSTAVREFRAKIPFHYAEVTPEPDRGALVIWRDLRVSYQETPGQTPAGVHVRLDATGRIVSERHHWWLTLW